MLRLVVMYAALIPEVALFIFFKHKSKAQGQSNVAKTLAVVVKALCTITVLITAVMGISLTEEGSSAHMILIAAGISLGLAGDVAICSDFLAGMLLFGVGHVCYIAAFLLISTHSLWSVPLLAVLYLLLLLILRKKLFPQKSDAKAGLNADACPAKAPPVRFRTGAGRSTFDMSEQKDMTSYRVPVMLYSFIILAMLSLAATLPFPASPVGISLLAGAVLFVASDAMLSWNTFGRYSSTLDTISLFCYFLAQSLFAVSIYITPQ